jgi:hypothetical protein
MPPPNWFEKWIKIHGVDLQGGSIIAPGTAAFTAVGFGHPPVWESDTFLAAGDTTRITVPDKLAGRYSLRATICWEKADNRNFEIEDRNKSCFLAYLTKNGDTLASHLEDTHMSAAPVVKAAKTVMHVLWEGTLRKDDFIKLYVKHDGTIKSDIGHPISVTANVWLILRRLGPPV